MLQQYVGENKQRAKDSCRPVPIEAHRDEWQNDIKRAKKAKEQGL